MGMVCLRKCGIDGNIRSVYSFELDDESYGKGAVNILTGWNHADHNLDRLPHSNKDFKCI